MLGLRRLTNGEIAGGLSCMNGLRPGVQRETLYSGAKPRAVGVEEGDGLVEQ
jgi:hypothetical protein